MGELILVLAQLYSLVILMRVLMSWVNIDPYSPIAKFLYDVTEPVMAPVRNLLPPAGGFDFSPIIVLIGIQLIASVIAQAFISAGL